MKKNTKHKGFTLIELLVVLSIIGLLGAVVGPQLMKHLGGAKSKATKLQVEDFGAALDMFYMDNGRYPDSQEGLNALVQAPTGLEGWNGPYMKKKKIPKDPWTIEYHYESPGQNGPYDLYSYGADNTQGGEKENADIVSWE